MKKVLTILLLCLVQSGIAQLTVDKKVVFVNQDSTKRQVLNHGEATQLSNSVNVKDVLINRLKTAASVSYSNNIISISTPIALSSNIIGLELSFVSDFSCQDSAQLSLNGLPAAYITKDYIVPIDSAHIDSGCVVTFVYDGTYFQITNQLKKCPSGFVAVDNNYCIERDERNADFIWNAIETCDSLGGNICSMAEWFYACENANLGLLNMTNNWEWIDHGNDHGTGGSVMGGFNGCQYCKSTNVNVMQNGSSNFYRCCFYR